MRKMSIVVGSKSSRLLKIPPEIYCKGCPIYEDRFKNAQLMKEFFGKEVVWDYAICRMSCIKREHTWRDWKNA